MKFRNGGAFTRDLRNEVDRYLAEHPGLLRRGRLELAVKAVIAAVLLVGSYLSVLLFHPGIQLLGVALVGLILGAILAGFCVQHDANHRATFSSQRWNHLLGWIFSDVCLGFGSYMWQTKHNVAHHTYTNLAGHDPDADQTPLLKLAPSQPGRRWYRGQVVYAWPLYLLMGFRMQFMAEVVGFSQGRVGRSPLRFPRGWARVGVFAGKALFLGWTFLVPILMGFPWWGVLACYLVVVGTLSLVMTVVFQLAHCVTEATYATPEQLGAADERTEWMVYQVQTTVDFSPRNPAALLVARRSELPGHPPSLPQASPSDLPTARSDRPGGLPEARPDLPGPPEHLVRLPLPRPTPVGDGQARPAPRARDGVDERPGDLRRPRVAGRQVRGASF